MEPMTAKTYFRDMLTLLQNARLDKRLRPSTLLVYRTLCDLANKSFWTYPFIATRDELKELTHLTSNQDIDSAKQALKNLGYIDFSGRPNKFTVYRPPGALPVRQQGNNASPEPPKAIPQTSYHTNNRSDSRDNSQSHANHDNGGLDWLNHR